MSRITRFQLAEIQGAMNGHPEIARAAKARGIDIETLMEAACAYVERNERERAEVAQAQEAARAQTKHFDPVANFPPESPRKHK